MKGLKKASAALLALVMVIGAASCDSSTEKSKTETEASQEVETTEKQPIPENSIPEETEESVPGGNGNIGRRREGADEDTDLLMELSGGYKFAEDPDEYVLKHDDPEIINTGMIVTSSYEEATHLFAYIEDADFTPFVEEDRDTLCIDDCITMTDFVRELNDEQGSVYTLGTADDGQLTINMDSPLSIYHEEVVIMKYEDENKANEVFQNYVNKYFSNLEMSEEEYKSDGSEGYLVVNIDHNDFVKFMCKETDATEEEIEAYKEMFGDFRVVDAIYQKGDKVIKLYYMNTVGSTDYCTVEYLASKGFSNPFELENTDGLLDRYSNLYSRINVIDG